MLFWRRRHEIRDEELSAYVDGELNSAALERVESHLESCVACRETVVELQAVHEAVSGLPRVRAPRSFALSQADVVAQPRGGASGLFGSATPLLSGVAAIAIVAFVVLAGVDMRSDGGATGEFAGAGSEESAALSLDDERNGEAIEADSAAPRDVSEPSDADAGDAEGDGERNGTAYGDENELASLPEGETNAIRGDGMNQSTDDDDKASLRIAESVAAAVAVSAGGAALLIWWRRRQSDLA